MFERTTDDDRTPNADGCLLFATQSNLTTICRYIPRTGSVPAAEGANGVGCFPPTAQTTGLHGSGDVSVYPVFAYGIGEIKQPFLGIVGAFTANFTGQSQYTVGIRGVNQNMLMMSGGTIVSAWLRGSVPTNANFMPMMRYE